MHNNAQQCTTITQQCTTIPTTMHNNAQQCTIMHNNAMHNNACTTIHNNAQHNNAQQCTTMHNNAQQCTTMHNNALGFGFTGLPKTEAVIRRHTWIAGVGMMCSCTNSATSLIWPASSTGANPPPPAPNSSGLVRVISVRATWAPVYGILHCAGSEKLCVRVMRRVLREVLGGGCFAWCTILMQCK
jgi:hypothetical protein